MKDIFNDWRFLAVMLACAVIQFRIGNIEHKIMLGPTFEAQQLVINRMIYMQAEIKTLEVKIDQLTLELGYTKGEL